MRHRALGILLAVLMLQPIRGLQAQWMESVVHFAGPSLRERLDSLDTYAQRVRRDWAIPGMAVAVIKDGHLVFSEGYGVQDYETNVPVSSKSVFQIGSVTKSFTAALMAMLVDEGLVSWDDRMCDVLPGFKLYDKDMEQTWKVRDLFCHGSGLGNNVGTWMACMGYNREQILQILSEVPPQGTYHKGFAYNNAIFLWASALIEHLTGKSWEDNMRERIFKPLGLSSAVVGEQGFLDAGKNAVSQYSFSYYKGKASSRRLKGEARGLYWADVIGPAGGAAMNIDDLALWGYFHINQGMVKGLRIISPEQMQELHTGGNTVSSSQSYGKCWYLTDMGSYEIFYHTGTAYGHTSLCFCSEEDNLVVAIAASSEVIGRPRLAIAYRALDLFRLEKDGLKIDSLRDRNREALEAMNAGKVNMNSRTHYAKHPRQKEPTAAQIVGKYSKKEPYGPATISSANGKLFISIGPQQKKAPLVHLKDGRYSFYMGGHTFPLYVEWNDAKTAVKGFTIDFGRDEDVGMWKK